MEIELTLAEKRSIKAIQRVAMSWPHTLTLFSGNGTLTVRKAPAGKFYGSDTVVATVSGIPNDGGDGGDSESRRHV